MNDLTAVKSNFFFQFVTGKKQKRLRLNVSESDNDKPSKKRTRHYDLSDSDLESYDVSSRSSKEPASRRLYKKKGMSPKMTSSLSKRIHERKGIFVLGTCNEDTLLIHIIDTGKREIMEDNSFNQFLCPLY